MRRRNGHPALIGASRARLIGQLLTESLLLAVLGGMAGMVVAHWTLVLVLRRYHPTQHMITFSISGTVILFGIGLTFATGLLFGLFPRFTARGRTSFRRSRTRRVSRPARAAPRACSMLLATSQSRSPCCCSPRRVSS